MHSGEYLYSISDIFALIVDAEVSPGTRSACSLHPADVDLSEGRAGLPVSLSDDDFIRALRLMISGREVDDGWDLRESEDIAQAVSRGAVRSAKQHFLDDGYFEDRLSFPTLVDERWYLENYPDVAESVRKGVVGSGQQHFTEGWLPRGPPAFSALDACSDPSRHAQAVGGIHSGVVDAIE
jgi:hypothetical protein